MQISVNCHMCNEPKRPLTPCSICGAAPLAEVELQAWRITLHARHLARITDRPRPAPLPTLAERELTPQQVVVVLEEPGEPRLPATIIPLEPPLPASDARSFDWEDDSAGWLRRSA